MFQAATESGVHDAESEAPPPEAVEMESVQRCLSELEALVLRLTALEDMVAARQAAPLPAGQPSRVPDPPSEPRPDKGNAAGGDGPISLGSDVESAASDMPELESWPSSDSLDATTEASPKPAGGTAERPDTCAHSEGLTVPGSPEDIPEPERRQPDPARPSPPGRDSADSGRGRSSELDSELRRTPAVSPGLDSTDTGDRPVSADTAGHTDTTGHADSLVEDLAGLRKRLEELRWRRIFPSQTMSGAAGEPGRSPDSGELELSVVGDEPILPEPRTDVRTEEYTDELGRRVVVTTTVRTTYERAEDDDEGNAVVLERVHRRVQRVVYVDGEPQEVAEEEGGQGPAVEYVPEDFELPEPTETVTEEEYEDDQGRRVVVRTTLRTTFEETTDEDGCVVILEKQQKRIHRRIYEGDELVEEVEDGDSQPDVEGSAGPEVPPPSERVEVKEIVDELGRRVEFQDDDPSSATIIELVVRRVTRTVYVNDVVVELVEEDPSEPERRVVPAVSGPAQERVSPTTGENEQSVENVQDDDPSSATLIELVVRRVTRTVYVNDVVVEIVEEDPSEPERRELPAVSGPAQERDVSNYWRERSK
ncbi:hypothetical protein FJT64_005878 [Amphibalanus amphitrite]|uniref:Uncharacterized protein n=1 Tax=Amphibalanus amphitrite TaxID=1232801 RepID=A0A6A4W466_AMPAM|nr:hypothetical protein FJT64_005878 [Amphibalanus amphitrite]